MVALMLPTVVAAQDAEPLAAPYPIRRELTQGDPVATRRDIVALALADAQSLDEVARQFARYVWIPDWIEPASGFAQVSLVANSTFSRTSNIIRPESVADGRLVRIDLLRYATNDAQAADILRLYEQLAERDSFFNVKVKIVGDVAIVLDNSTLHRGDAIDIRFQNGQWGPAVFESQDGDRVIVSVAGRQWTVKATEAKFNGRLISDPPETPKRSPSVSFTAAADLNPDGAELFDLIGSSVPIMRLDEWVAFTFSTVNGGLYYSLAGIKADLESTIREFAGADAASKVIRSTAALRKASAESARTGESVAAIAGRFDPELAKSKALIPESAVTGRQRAVAFFYGAATSPAQGPQLVAVTFDIAEDNTDPDSDPLRNAAQFERYDGGEAIFSLPNGLLAYVVFDDQDKVIASVPDRVAHDFAAREVRSNVATTRVFSGVSCANCHERSPKNLGWQPVENGLHDSLRGLAKIFDDRSQRDQFQALQRVAAQYGASTADMQFVLDQARLPYQHSGQLATDMKSTREVVAGLADSYWGYWYDRVTPVTAARDLGQELSAEDAQLFLLRAIPPEPAHDLGEFLREDAVLSRLKDGKHVTPAQWREIIPSVSERLLQGVE